MYLSELRIQNFRQFGQEPIVVEFQPGIVALAGPNDSGKTTIIDAIRYALSTKDQEYVPVQAEDFHISESGDIASEIVISCKFEALSIADQGTFLEFLTPIAGSDPVLYIQWTATKKEAGAVRRWNDTTLQAGLTGEGPAIDAATKQLIASAYLKPLRDAEHEMSPGRNSRLSRVLNEFPDIKTGTEIDLAKLPSDIETIEALSLSGLSGYLRYLVNRHSGISTAKSSINSDYLSHLSLLDDNLSAEINFVSGPNEVIRLKQILERLELNLLNNLDQLAYGRYGLGSNNLLYMACELLLISKDRAGLPLLLIEEPEAHLHPQRQLQLMSFLGEKADPATNQPPMQVIISTHSPVLASKIKVENIVMVSDHGAFSLANGKTCLAASDYRFLGRFLDATKSNLFFARGVIIVEGDAEQLLLPTIARLIGRDLTKAGVSIVNVGSTGLSRYSRIFQRRLPEGDQGTQVLPTLQIPVASVTDRDIMPDSAPVIFGYVEDSESPKWTSPKRKWRIESDPKFVTDEHLTPAENFAMAHEAVIRKLHLGDDSLVKTFPSDHWTFEYDLARSGLARQVFIAARLAKADANIHKDKSPSNRFADAMKTAEEAFAALTMSHGLDIETLAIYVYREYAVGGASKAVSAQYLAQLLEDEFDGKPEETVAQLLPAYILKAIHHVTE